MPDTPRKRMGRPPKPESEAVLTKRFQTMLDPDSHAWVLAHGGGEYIRRLIAEDKKRNDELEREACRFYAVEHTFGSEIRDPKGRYIGFAYRFTTQAARDAFVKAGPKRETADRRTLSRMGFQERDFREGEDISD